MVRALPVASACLISLVERLVSVIFLRSPSPTPLVFFKWASNCCLSLSLNASLADFLATPAACNCSSRSWGDLWSSLANSATVFNDISCSFLPLFLILVLLLVEPVGTRLHDQCGGLFSTLAGQVG